MDPMFATGTTKAIDAPDIEIIVGLRGTIHHDTTTHGVVHNDPDGVSTTTAGTSIDDTIIQQESTMQHSSIESYRYHERK